MRAISLSFIILSVACSHSVADRSAYDDDSADLAGQQDLSEGQCTATATTIQPASDGQTDFFYRDEVIFTVTEGADTANVELASIDGEPVSGVTRVDNQVVEGELPRVIFTPNRPLNANTGYEATLDYCGGAPTVRFQTSELGTAIEDTADLVGVTYTMDMSQAKVVKPGSTAQAILTLLDNDLALQVNDVYADTLDITIAATDARTGDQDACVPSLGVAMAGNFSEAPAFKIGPVDVPFVMAGYTVVLYDAIAEATFVPSGKYFAGGRMAGTVDARDVVLALGTYDVLPTDSPEALCEILAGVNMPCEPCRDDEPYCLFLEIRNVSGNQAEMDLEQIDGRNCHEDCADSCDNAECDAADDFPVCL